MMKIVVSLGQIDAILLTAGASKRLGEPKALADIHGKSLIQIIIRKLKKEKMILNFHVVYQEIIYH